MNKTHVFIAWVCIISRLSLLDVGPHSGVAEDASVLEHDTVCWACIFNVSKDCSAFILGVKESSILGLLGPEDKGTIVL